MGETELILLQGRMMEFRLRDIGHFSGRLFAAVGDRYYPIGCQMPTAKGDLVCACSAI
jgi:hypothetical protein